MDVQEQDRAEVREELAQSIGEIMRKSAAGIRLGEPVEPDAPVMTFGMWLRDQLGRDDAIGDLARASRRDSGFPVMGTVDEVRLRMKRMGAEWEMLEALDQAEREWEG